MFMQTACDDLSESQDVDTQTLSSKLIELLNWYDCFS